MASFDLGSDPAPLEQLVQVKRKSSVQSKRLTGHTAQCCRAWGSTESLAKLLDTLVTHFAQYCRVGWSTGSTEGEGRARQLAAAHAAGTRHDHAQTTRSHARASSPAHIANVHVATPRSKALGATCNIVGIPTAFCATNAPANNSRQVSAPESSLGNQARQQVQAGWSLAQ